MIVYTENLKECTCPPQKILELKNELRHIAGYKIAIKIIVFLYTKITSQTSQEVRTRRQL